jgi:hypothetical protein
VDGQWILGALLGIAWFVAGFRGVRWAIGRAARSGEATVEGSWQHDLKKQLLEDGTRFKTNVHYFVSLGAMGLCFAVAAVFAAVPVWVGVLGFAMAVLGAAATEARIRYGTGSVADLGRVVRSWLRLSA